uniref:Uncharacterized protein n=1 Tax=Candidatus Kentrum sp. UNK TaxID=2126344 RepID=A0A451AP23_9GAMM|nr:MAG: hypothetical protein BECKUNK1418G_GA0071005_11632 [Candidatus Kentron sp. UNK]
MSKKVYVNYPNLKDEEINGMRNFNTIDHVIMLNRAKRFTDLTYADFLNNVRWGIATEEDYEKLSRRVFKEND